MAIGRQAVEYRANRQIVGQIEPCVRRLERRQSWQQGRVGGVDRRQRQTGSGGGKDLLPWFVVGRRKAGAQAFVTRQDGVQGPLQRGHVQGTVQTHGDRHDIGGGRALELLQEPQSALRRGQRKSIGTAAGGDRRQGRPFRVPKPGGEQGGCRRFEHRAHGQIHAEHRADLVDQAGRRQGIAAKIEKVIVCRDIDAAQHMAEQGYDFSGLRAVGPDFRGGLGRGFRWGRKLRHHDDTSGHTPHRQMAQQVSPQGLRVDTAVADGGLHREARGGGVEGDIAHRGVGEQDCGHGGGAHRVASVVNDRIGRTKQLDRPVGPASRRLAGRCRAEVEVSGDAAEHRPAVGVPDIDIQRGRRRPQPVTAPLLARRVHPLHAERYRQSGGLGDDEKSGLRSGPQQVGEGDVQQGAVIDQQHLGACRHPGRLAGQQDVAVSGLTLRARRQDRGPGRTQRRRPVGAKCRRGRVGDVQTVAGGDFRRPDPGLDVTVESVGADAERGGVGGPGAACGPARWGGAVGDDRRVGCEEQGVEQGAIPVGPVAHRGGIEQIGVVVEIEQHPTVGLDRVQGQRVLDEADFGGRQSGGQAVEAPSARIAVLIERRPQGRQGQVWIVPDHVFRAHVLMVPQFAERCGEPLQQRRPGQRRIHLHDQRQQRGALADQRVLAHGGLPGARDADGDPPGAGQPEQQRRPGPEQDREGRGVVGPRRRPDRRGGVARDFPAQALSPPGGARGREDVGRQIQRRHVA